MFDQNSTICYQHIKKDRAKKLVVSFTGMATRVPFDFYKTFTALGDDYDVLFLADPCRAFYTQGVRGFADTENTIWTNIRMLGDYSQYYFVGTSMGGYGAAYHGWALAKYCDITSDGFKVNILVMNPYIHPRLKKAFKFGRDLSEYLTPCHSLGKVWLVHGAKQSDRIQAQLMIKSLPCEVTFYPDCKEHGIPIWLKERKLLSPLVEKFLS